MTAASNGFNGLVNGQTYDDLAPAAGLRRNRSPSRSRAPAGSPWRARRSRPRRRTTRGLADWWPPCVPKPPTS